MFECDCPRCQEEEKLPPYLKESFSPFPHQVSFISGCSTTNGEGEYNENGENLENGENELEGENSENDTTTGETENNDQEYYAQAREVDHDANDENTRNTKLDENNQYLNGNNIDAHERWGRVVTIIIVINCKVDNKMYNAKSDSRYGTVQNCDYKYNPFPQIRMQKYR